MSVPLARLTIIHFSQGIWFFFFWIWASLEFRTVIVRVDPKLVERYPNLKEDVDGLIPNCEISSLLHRIFDKWSTVCYALVLTCWPSISKKFLKVTLPPKIFLFFVFDIFQDGPWMFNLYPSQAITCKTLTWKILDSLAARTLRWQRNEVTNVEHCYSSSSSADCRS